MVPSWTVTLSYIAYAAMLFIGAACWLAVLSEHIVYGRVELQLLDARWLEWSRLALRQVRPALWLGLACGGVAFVSAALPAPAADPVAQAHKAWQLRYGAVALCFLAMLALARGRMGAFDADIAAVVVFAWGAWLLVAGWRAYAGEAAAATPVGWWLALAIDLLLIGAFALLWIIIEIEGFRLF